MKIEVGDWVVSLVTENGVNKGRQYKVVEVDKSGRWVDVLDDECEIHTLRTSEYSAPPYATKTSQYTRILEAIAGPDLCKMARNISEALDQ